MSEQSELLAQIVEQNERIIGLLEGIHGELNWVNEHSLGKMLMDRLDQIEDATSSVGALATSIDSELQWTDASSMAGVLRQGLEEIADRLDQR